MLRTAVSIHLFLKPSLEMDIEESDCIDPEILRRKGDELPGRLHAVAEVELGIDPEEISLEEEEIEKIAVSLL